MKLKKLIEGLEYTASADVMDTEITAICCDSRKVTNGAVFVCLEGGIDGHDFAQSAQQNGAKVIVANRKTDSTLPHIIVENTREAMFFISAKWFDNPEKKMRFVGITGTNGKTSTAYYIKNILDSLGKTTGLIGTVANIIGNTVLPSCATTPEPYSLMQLLNQMYLAGVEYVVMEVSSHSLDQKRVCGIHFDVAVFTNLTQDHLDYHKTMENYKAAKAKLFENASFAVLNIDDEMGKQLSNTLEINKFTYSKIFNQADLVAKDVKIRPSGVRFITVTKGGLARVNVASPGGFTVLNALAAIGAVLALGITFDDIMPHIENIAGVEGRAQIISGDRPFTVMIDYAHTPDGLDNILSSISSYAKGRVITLFGCGGDRDKTKRAIMGESAAKQSDFLIVTSDNPRTEQPLAIIDDIMVGVKKHHTPYIIIENRRDAIKYAIENAKADDIILLAGKGHEKYQITNDGKIDFDEQAIALEYMKEFEK